MSTNPTPQTVTKVSPSARVLRTLYMTILAVATAIPAATAAFGFSAETAAKLIGFAGGITVLVTAVWNALEGQGLIPTVHGKTTTPADTRFYVNEEPVGPGSQAVLKSPAKKAASRRKAPPR